MWERVCVCVEGRGGVQLLYRQPKAGRVSRERYGLFGHSTVQQKVGDATTHISPSLHPPSLSLQSVPHLQGLPDIMRNLEGGVRRQHNVLRWGLGGWRVGGRGWGVAAGVGLEGRG